MNTNLVDPSIKILGYIIAASYFFTSACTSQDGHESPQESTKTPEEEESDTSTGVEDLLPPELAEIFQEFWTSTTESNTIYCDCNPNGDLCFEVSPGLDKFQYECTIEAIALDPVGSKTALKCDLAWATTELNCLEEAQSCKEIESPPNDEASCAELAQEFLDACPSYPEEVEDALDGCYERRRTRILRDR